MEIDVAALQRLPEMTEIDGLRPIKGKCLPGKKTQVLCITRTCRKTQIIVQASPT
jgi:hypothetical protein